MPEHTQAKAQKSQAVATQRSASSGPEMQGADFGLQQGMIPPGLADRRSITPTEAMYLQRSAGNRAVGQLLGKNRAGAFVQRMSASGLRVGPADDPYEREANQIAQEVVSHPSIRRSPQSHPQSYLPSYLQRLPAAPVAPIGNAGGATSGDFEKRVLANNHNGKPLPDRLRRTLEPKLGADLSSVRVHTDSHAVQLSRDINAKAFAHKEHIYYGAGQSPNDLRLTAHESVHAIQQGAVKHLQRRSLALAGTSVASRGVTKHTQAPSSFVASHWAPQLAGKAMPASTGAPESIQRALNFNAQQLGDNRSTTLSIDGALGTSEYLEIKKKLKKYESAQDAAKKLTYLMQLRLMAEAWLDKHETRKQTGIKKVEAKFEKQKNQALDNSNDQPSWKTQAKWDKLKSNKDIKLAKVDARYDSSRRDALKQLIFAIIDEAPKLAPQVKPEDMYTIQHSFPEHFYHSMLEEALTPGLATTRHWTQEKYLSGFQNQPGPNKFEHLSNRSRDFVSGNAKTDKMIEAESDVTKRYGVTKAENAAIKVYTSAGADYRYINSATAGDDEWTQDVYQKHFKPKTQADQPNDPVKLETLKNEGRQHGEALQSGVNKMPDAKPTTLYRGLILTQEKFRAQYQTSNVKSPNEITMPAFTSASRKLGTAEDMAQYANADKGEVAVILTMWVTKGKDINSLSANGGEQEVLILPGAKFKKTSEPVRDGTFYKVSLTQIA